ncbi:hypothetical protein DUZ99_05765 [Xylanibacillus composti]|uniref:Uncharacterized protein n=1 Tax=Xylanibacillus composti TaxID=1572762 RepID=A0A8J4H6G9_9BACL|nr:hypothetical protein [Xylanibacillus composti]MDT9724496.1 hypothetical protein [Xylanibacillus composti]GIQ69759.1 hypothetical protein XYCOK13_25830 [Xylanibacillus composti]
MFGRGGFRRTGYRKVRIAKFVLLLFLVLLLVVTLLIRSFSRGESAEAREAVIVFYRYEQTGDFGSAWEMFHPYMQQKFNKAQYIKTRNHVILEHFGVDTFAFTVGSAKLIGNWTMSFDAPALSNVYQIPVTQHFQGRTFGLFDLHQEVYAVKLEGAWRIIWDYP